VYEDRAATAARFAQLWSSSRYQAGVSQEYMAMEMGVSKKTIQNWEKGISSPSLFQGFEWFNILGLNPLHYYLQFLHPDLFIGNNDDEIKASLIAFVENCTPAEREQLLYTIAGVHGSDWYGLLQMFTAHCHTTMQSRVAAAHIILNNYKIEQAQGKLLCEDIAAPDIELLENAVLKGMLAAKDGAAGYTAINQNNEPPQGRL